MPETHPSAKQQVLIAGRLVVIRHGTKSQTVNVCTEANSVGSYQERYRLPAFPPVVATDLQELARLEDLRAWLEAQNADPEAVAAGSPGAGLPHLVSDQAVDRDWLSVAVADVEDVISSLVEQFLEHPYLHRVEHSLHAELFQMLKAKPHLSEHASLLTGERTQLLHKEWPETIPRRTDGVERKRGSFDLAVVAPSQVARASLDQWRAGRIAAPIVIEVGLDYGYSHLDQDREKLLNSHVKAGYLLHLSRIAVTNSAKVETLACTPQAGIRTAYVHHDPLSKTRRVKHLGDTTISTRKPIVTHQ